MTVQELIQLLSLFPPDTKVLGGDYTGEADLTADDIIVTADGLVFPGGRYNEWTPPDALTVTKWLETYQGK